MSRVQIGQRAASEGQRGGRRGQEGQPAPLNRLAGALQELIVSWLGIKPRTSWSQDRQSTGKPQSYFNKPERRANSVTAHKVRIWFLHPALFSQSTISIVSFESPLNLLFETCSWHTSMMLLYLFVTRKSVHRTLMPPPKCHSEKSYICNCDRYSHRYLGSVELACNW